MLKVIKLNRYVLEKGVIQHNVIVNVATLLGDEKPGGSKRGVY